MTDPTATTRNARMRKKDNRAGLVRTEVKVYREDVQTIRDESRKLREAREAKTNVDHDH